MKKIIKSLVVLCSLSIITTSCFKDDDFKFDKVRLIEFEDAVRLTPPAGFTHGVVSLTRTSPPRSFQVNLVGKQLEAPQVVQVSIDTAISKFLNSTTIRAEAGVHYDLKGGTLTIDAAKSTALLNLTIPTTFPQNTGKTALLVLKLDGNETIKPSENYRRIGVRISLN